MIKYWRLLVASIVSLVVLFALHDLFISSGIEFRFRHTADKDIEYQIFFTEKKSPKFCQHLSVKKQIYKGKKEARIFIPTQEIERLRIDVGKKPGNVKLENISICGEHNIPLSGKMFRPINIEQFSANENGVSLCSKEDDPQLVYKTPLNLHNGIHQIDYKTAIGIAIIAFYLIYVLLDICSSLSIKQSNNTKKVPSLQNVEFLRILFTLGVLVTHFFVYYKIWNAGGQGVQFFFLLSGYLLALTYRPTRSIMSFISQRWCRFVPLVVAGGILCGGGWKSLNGMLMMQNSGLTFGDVPNAPAWYIGVLFWCSLFYLVLLKTLQKRHMLLATAVIGFLTLSMTIHGPSYRLDLVMGFIPNGMLRGLSCMAIGILLAHFCKRIPNEIVDRKRKWVYTLAEIGILYYVVVGCFDRDIWSKFWVIQILSHLFLLYLFIVKRGYITDMLEKPLFGKLSKYCLAIYLTHYMFCKTIKPLISDELQENALLCLTTAMVGSCILGILAYHLVEIPCNRYLTRFLVWLKQPK